MIKIDKGNVEISGTKTLIQSEVTVLLYALRDHNTLTDEEIDDMVRMSRKSEEEIEDMVSNKKKELARTIGDSKNIIEYLLKKLGE